MNNVWGNDPAFIAMLRTLNQCENVCWFESISLKKSWRKLSRINILNNYHHSRKIIKVSSQWNKKEIQPWHFQRSSLEYVIRLQNARWTNEASVHGLSQQTSHALSPWWSPLQRNYTIYFRKFSLSMQHIMIIVYCWDACIGEVLKPE